MARIIGKDALPPGQQHVLMCAELINESFLRQSAFSEVDRYCSAERQSVMMKTITRFIESSKAAVDAGISIETISSLPIMRRLMRMGEEIGEADLDKFEDLHVELDAVFATLMQEIDREAVTDES
jgi:V/A-type H+-transporting ATPase subunit A